MKKEMSDDSKKKFKFFFVSGELRQQAPDQLVSVYEWNLKIIFLTKKYIKIAKLILHTFQNIAHLLGQKEFVTSFERGGVGDMTLTGTGAKTKILL